MNIEYKCYKKLQIHETLGLLGLLPITGLALIRTFPAQHRLTSYYPNSYNWFNKQIVHDPFQPVKVIMVQTNSYDKKDTKEAGSIGQERSVEVGESRRRQTFNRNSLW
jgi:hypothetical protein